jgi:predicted ester cyclase
MKADALGDANRKLVLRFIERVRNGGDLDALEEFLAPAIVEHAPSGRMESTTIEVAEIRRQYAGFRAMFPHTRFDLSMLVAEGDLVATCGVLTATGTGAMGAEGVVASRPEMRLYRIADGRIVETWAVMDLLGWRQQLGLSTVAPAIPVVDQSTADSKPT